MIQPGRPPPSWARQALRRSPMPPRGLHHVPAVAPPVPYPPRCLGIRQVVQAGSCYLAEPKKATAGRRHSPPVKSTRIQQALPQSIYRAPSRRPSTHFRVPVGRRAPFQEPPNRLGDPRHVQPPWRRCLRQSSSQPQRQGRKHSRQKIGQNRAPGGQAGLGRPCSAEPIAQGSTPKERWPWPCHLKQYAS
mgnify:CR=1 FL=1